MSANAGPAEDAEEMDIEQHNEDHAIDAAFESIKEYEFAARWKGVDDAHLFLKWRLVFRLSEYLFRRDFGVTFQNATADSVLTALGEATDKVSMLVNATEEQAARFKTKAKEHWEGRLEKDVVAMEMDDARAGQKASYGMAFKNTGTAKTCVAALGSCVLSWHTFLRQNTLAAFEHNATLAVKRSAEVMVSRSALLDMIVMLAMENFSETPSLARPFCFFTQTLFAVENCTFFGPEDIAIITMVTGEVMKQVVEFSTPSSIEKMRTWETVLTGDPLLIQIVCAQREQKQCKKFPVRLGMIHRDATMINSHAQGNTLFLVPRATLHYEQAARDDFLRLIALRYTTYEEETKYMEAIRSFGEATLGLTAEVQRLMELTSLLAKGVREVTEIATTGLSFDMYRDIFPALLSAFRDAYAICDCQAFKTKHSITLLLHRILLVTARYAAIPVIDANSNDTLDLEWGMSISRTVFEREIRTSTSAMADVLTKLAGPEVASETIIEAFHDTVKAIAVSRGTSLVQIPEDADLSTRCVLWRIALSCLDKSDVKILDHKKNMDTAALAILSLLSDETGDVDAELAANQLALLGDQYPFSVSNTAAVIDARYRYSLVWKAFSRGGNSFLKAIPWAQVELVEYTLVADALYQQRQGGYVLWDESRWLRNLERAIKGETTVDTSPEAGNLRKLADFVITHCTMEACMAARKEIPSIVEEIEKAYVHLMCSRKMEEMEKLAIFPESISEAVRHTSFPLNSEGAFMHSLEIYGGEERVVWYIHHVISYVVACNLDEAGRKGLFMRMAQKYFADDVERIVVRCMDDFVDVDKELHAAEEDYISIKSFYTPPSLPSEDTDREPNPALQKRARAENSGDDDAIAQVRDFFGDPYPAITSSIIDFGGNSRDSTPFQRGISWLGKLSGSDGEYEKVCWSPIVGTIKNVYKGVHECMRARKDCLQNVILSAARGDDEPEHEHLRKTPRADLLSLFGGIIPRDIIKVIGPSPVGEIVADRNIEPMLPDEEEPTDDQRRAEATAAMNRLETFITGPRESLAAVQEELLSLLAKLCEGRGLADLEKQALDMGHGVLQPQTLTCRIATPVCIGESASVFLPRLERLVWCLIRCQSSKVRLVCEKPGNVELALRNVADFLVREVRPVDDPTQIQALNPSSEGVGLGAFPVIFKDAVEVPYFRGELPRNVHLFQVLPVTLSLSGKDITTICTGKKTNLRIANIGSRIHGQLQEGSWLQLSAIQIIVGKIVELRQISSVVWDTDTGIATFDINKPILQPEVGSVAVYDVVVNVFTLHTTEVRRSKAKPNTWKPTNGTFPEDGKVYVISEGTSLLLRVLRAYVSAGGSTKKGIEWEVTLPIQARGEYAKELTVLKCTPNPAELLNFAQSSPASTVSSVVDAVSVLVAMLKSPAFPATSDGTVSLPRVNKQGRFSGARTLHVHFLEEAHARAFAAAADVYAWHLLFDNRAKRNALFFPQHTTMYSPLEALLAAHREDLPAAVFKVDASKPEGHVLDADFACAVLIEVIGASDGGEFCERLYSWLCLKSHLPSVTSLVSGFTESLALTESNIPLGRDPSTTELAVVRLLQYVLDPEVSLGIIASAIHPGMTREMTALFTPGTIMRIVNACAMDAYPEIAKFAQEENGPRGVDVRQDSESKSFTDKALAEVPDNLYGTYAYIVKELNLLDMVLQDTLAPDFIGLRAANEGHRLKVPRVFLDVSILAGVGPQNVSRLLINADKVRMETYEDDGEEDSNAEDAEISPDGEGAVPMDTGVGATASAWTTTEKKNAKRTKLKRVLTMLFKMSRNTSGVRALRELFVEGALLFCAEMIRFCQDVIEMNATDGNEKSVAGEPPVVKKVKYPRETSREYAFPYRVLRRVHVALCEGGAPDFLARVIMRHLHELSLDSEVTGRETVAASIPNIQRVWGLLVSAIKSEAHDVDWLPGLVDTVCLFLYPLFEFLDTHARRELLQKCSVVAGMGYGIFTSSQVYSGNLLKSVRKEGMDLLALMESALTERIEQNSSASTAQPLKTKKRTGADLPKYAEGILEVMSYSDRCCALYDLLASLMSDRSKLQTCAARISAIFGVNVLSGDTFVLKCCLTSMIPSPDVEKYMDEPTRKLVEIFRTENGFGSVGSQSPTAALINELEEHRVIRRMLPIEKWKEGREEIGRMAMHTIAGVILWCHGQSSSSGKHAALVDITTSLWSRVFPRATHEESLAAAKRLKDTFEAVARDVQTKWKGGSFNYGFGDMSYDYACDELMRIFSANFDSKDSDLKSLLLAAGESGILAPVYKVIAMSAAEGAFKFRSTPIELSERLAEVKTIKNKWKDHTSTTKFLHASEHTAIPLVAHFASDLRILGSIFPRATANISVKCMPRDIPWRGRVATLLQLCDADVHNPLGRAQYGTVHEVAQVIAMALPSTSATNITLIAGGNAETAMFTETVGSIPFKRFGPIFNQFGCALLAERRTGEARATDLPLSAALQGDSDIEQLTRWLNNQKGNLERIFRSEKNRGQEETAYHILLRQLLDVLPDNSAAPRFQIGTGSSVGASAALFGLLTGTGPFTQSLPGTDPAAWKTMEVQAACEVYESGGARTMQNALVPDGDAYHTMRDAYQRARMWSLRMLLRTQRHEHFTERVLKHVIRVIRIPTLSSTHAVECLDMVLEVWGGGGEVVTIPDWVRADNTLWVVLSLCLRAALGTIALAAVCASDDTYSDILARYTSGLIGRGLYENNTYPILHYTGESACKSIVVTEVSSEVLVDTSTTIELTKKSALLRWDQAALLETAHTKHVAHIAVDDVDRVFYSEKWEECKAKQLQETVSTLLSPSVIPTINNDYPATPSEYSRGTLLGVVLPNAPHTVVVAEALQFLQTCSKKVPAILRNLSAKEDRSVSELLLILEHARTQLAAHANECSELLQFMLGMNNAQYSGLSPTVRVWCASSVGDESAAALSSGFAKRVICSNLLRAPGVKALARLVMLVLDIPVHAAAQVHAEHDPLLNALSAMVLDYSQDECTHTTVILQRVLCGGSYVRVLEEPRPVIPGPGFLAHVLSQVMEGPNRNRVPRHVQETCTLVTQLLQDLDLPGLPMRAASHRGMLGGAVPTTLYPHWTYLLRGHGGDLGGNGDWGSLVALSNTPPGAKGYTADVAVARMVVNTLSEQVRLSRGVVLFTNVLWRAGTSADADTLNAVDQSRSIAFFTRFNEALGGMEGDQELPEDVTLGDIRLLLRTHAYKLVGPWAMFFPIFVMQTELAAAVDSKTHEVVEPVDEARAVALLDAASFLADEYLKPINHKSKKVKRAACDAIRQLALSLPSGEEVVARITAALFAAEPPTHGKKVLACLFHRLALMRFVAAAQSPPLEL